MNRDAVLTLLWTAVAAERLAHPPRQPYPPAGSSQVLGPYPANSDILLRMNCYGMSANGCGSSSKS